MPAESTPGPFLGAIPPPMTRAPLSLPRRESTTTRPQQTGGLLSFAHADATNEVRRRAEELAATRTPFAQSHVLPGHSQHPILQSLSPVLNGPAATLPGGSASPLPGGFDPARRMEWELNLHRRAWELDERERGILRGQQALFDRERQVAELEAKLAEYEREAAQRPAQHDAMSNAEFERKHALLDSMSATLAQREKALSDARKALTERQSYVEHAEAQLLAKLEAISKLEQDLDARAAELARRENTAPSHAA
jgi:hypothetical protein